MSFLYTHVSENAERVIDPIAQQVIYSLMKKLSIYEYFKDNTHFYNDRSASSLFDRPTGELNLAAYNRLDVTVDTKFNPDSDQLFDGLSNGINSPPNWLTNNDAQMRREVFADERINFRVRELNMPFTLAFTIEMRFREYDGAILALSNILNRSSKELINEVHDITYSYPFDASAWSIFTQVFNRRATYKKAHPKDTILEWLDSISKTNWGFDIRRPDLSETARLKNNIEYIVTRNQMSCSAKLECGNSKPEPIMVEKAPVGYSLSCQYTIQFGRPHLLEFEIPPIVEQNPMPAVLFNNYEETDDPNLFGEAEVPAMTQMMWNSARADQRKAYKIKMPEYDSWEVPSQDQLRDCNFLPFLIAIVGLDEVGGNTDIDLTDLGDVALADFTLEIMSKMSTYELLNYSGLFNVTIYANDLPLEHDFISWDSEKKIISFTGNKQETVYRIVISEASVLDYIDQKWKDTLINYRQYLPLALMRTIGYQSQVGILWVVGDTSFTTFISKMMFDGRLVKLTNEMIKKGCNRNIRKYLNDIKGYIRFVCNTEYLDRRYTIFDLLLSTAKELNYLSNNDSFGRLINIDGIDNYVFTVGGTPNGNYEPLRIFKTDVSRA